MIRVCSAYRVNRTVSAAAIQVLASIPPIDLLSYERHYNFGADQLAKKLNRECLINKWQERWNKAEVGRWTWSLIPDLKVCCDRTHEELSFYLTQAFSGHGNFSSYLYKIGKREDESCVWCKVPDTAEHTIFICTKWVEERAWAEEQVGQV